MSPKYSVDPSWCPGELIVSAPGIDSDIDITQDTQIVTFTQITDSLVKSGESALVQKDYTVTITYRTKDYFKNNVDDTVSYTQEVKDPCID